jgi:intein/homing endonuclease
MALKTKSAFINCIPVFIASDKKWAKKFERARTPIIGDDIKSQIGATIVHRVLAKLCSDRGATIDKTYQINVGGNSVSGDQMILIKINGEIKYLPIGEFIDSLMKKYKIKKKWDGKEVLLKEDSPEKIQCFTIDDNFKMKLVPVEAFIRHKINEPLYEIETEGGRKIKITKDHNLFILDEKGELAPIPVKDLKKEKSLIAVPENLFSFQKEKKFVNLKAYFEDIIEDSSYRRGKVRVKNSLIKVVGFPKLKIPIKFPLSDEFLQIVGLWLADGSYDRKESGFNIELACGDDLDCVKVVKKFCKDFNLSFRIHGKKKVALRINSKTLGRIFKICFNLKGNVYTKRVPEWIFNLSDRQISEVLKGYLSGDGGDIGKQIRWSSVSEELIRDIQTLFLRIGINSTIFKEKYTEKHRGYPTKLGYCWHGLITGYRDFKYFIEKVGFIQREKNQKALAILKNVKRESLKEKLIPNLPVLRKKWGIKSTSWWKTPQISAKVVLAQIDKINPDENFRENIYNVCTGETKFLKIKKIKQIKNPKGEYVYDLSVKPYERFICSNILVHNTDFLNMKEQERLESKKISKTQAVTSQLDEKIKPENIYIGPSDFIPFLGNKKLAFIRIEGKMFADIPFSLELRLDVDDKANSAGIVIDAIRLAKLALDRKIGEPLISASAYLMKHPPQQFSDDKAREMIEEFIIGTSQQ